MKRKLDEKNEPVPAPAAAADAVTTTFADLNLDSRLLQGLASQGFERPTAIQREAIPLLLDGKSLLGKAKTGTGKTAVYLLPILQSILKRKSKTSSASCTALILVPTKELADQVYKAIDTFSSYCVKQVCTVKLADKLPDAVQRSLLANQPDIVVATPGRAWHNIKNEALSLKGLTHLVLDEADLVLSYGYNEDLENIAGLIPKGVQTILMSATLSTDISTLKGIFFPGREPTVLDLQEPTAEGEGLSQFVVKCAEDEKFLLTYVIFKLLLIKGKCIIFVNDVDRCYRLKLFLEQFGIRSCILNSELPVNSRIHVVEEFNKNVYDILICSDENEALGDEDAPQAADVEPAHNETSNSPAKKKRKNSKRDKEFGVSRGIDFRNTSTVLNFDLPRSSRSYTHRTGRVARAGQSGMALSFVIPKEEFRKHIPTSIETAENDEKVLAKIVKQQAKNGKEIRPYNFDMKQVESFRYRHNDALRAVTKVAIREARTRELRQELLKSEKLKRHFEENPAELHHLRHDGELRTARTQAHLKHVPEYLLPKEGKKALTYDGFVPFRKERGGKGKGRRSKSFKGGKSRRIDPLKSFKGRTKK